MFNPFKIKNNALIKYNGKEKSVIIPEGIKIIGNKCFSHNTHIKEIILPKSCDAIYEYAFNNCTNLEKINLDNVKLIEDYAFANCGFKEIELKNKECIYVNAFYKCLNLKTVKLINCLNVTDLFAYSNIEKIYIDNCTLSLYDCDKLKIIEFGKGYNYDQVNEIIGYDNPKLEKVIGPDIITEDGVVYNKDKTVLIAYLESKKDEIYKMPNTVKDICGNAIFNNQYLKELYFSKNINFLCNAAICSDKLEKIKFNNIKEIEEGAINNYSKKLTVEIPSDANIDNSFILYNYEQEIIIKIKNKNIIHKSINELKENNPNVLFIENKSLNELIEEGKTFKEASQIIKDQER